MMSGAVDSITAKDFLGFIEFARKRLGLPVEVHRTVAGLLPNQLYETLGSLGIASDRVAKLVAEYMRLEYVARVDPRDVKSGLLPAQFVRANSVLALARKEGGTAFVVSNPFKRDLIEALKRHSISRETCLAVTAPENIEPFLGVAPDSPGQKEESPRKTMDRVASAPAGARPGGGSNEESKVVRDADSLLLAAVTARASDIHIEPKTDHVAVRFRVDGDMAERFFLDKTTGGMVIARFKALGFLDIAEKRKPQDGALETTIDERTFKLRLSTSSTPAGESLVIRLLEPETKQKELHDLGMADRQVQTVVDLANRPHGLLLFVGPTGSGKTTTIYSLMSKVDLKKRSLMSVEDPVEYRIPLAVQQQVNEKAGVTFEALLKAAVRQDPDIMYIGEVRDPFSARIAIDFASIGHLTVSTLHTSNATTAIFRLERLGITRGQMAESLIGVVAQRLLKKLCPNCKKILPTSEYEAEMLRPFTRDIPEQIAHPVGCPRCGGTGYFGRVGIYEVIAFDHEIWNMVRADKSIAEIRAHVAGKGEYLISHHGAEKVRQLLCAPKDVYEHVFIEEGSLPVMRPTGPELEGTRSRTPVTAESRDSGGSGSILVIEDDKDTQNLIVRFLENAGYQVTVANDGIDGLIQLSTNPFQLIISDVKMPNLDGFKFMEVKNQKGIETPVIFLTSQIQTDAEVTALELGAVDFIRKPVEKNVLLPRIKRALQGIQRATLHGNC